MRKLGEQWVEVIDGKKHMLKALPCGEVPCQSFGYEDGTAVSPYRVSFLTTASTSSKILASSTRMGVYRVRSVGSIPL